MPLHLETLSNLSLDLTEQTSQALEFLQKGSVPPAESIQ